MYCRDAQGFYYKGPKIKLNWSLWAEKKKNCIISKYINKYIWLVPGLLFSCNSVSVHITFTVVFIGSLKLFKYNNNNYIILYNITLCSQMHVKLTPHEEMEYLRLDISSVDRYFVKINSAKHNIRDVLLLWEV